MAIFNLSFVFDNLERVCVYRTASYTPIASCAQMGAAESSSPPKGQKSLHSTGETIPTPHSSPGLTFPKVRCAGRGETRDKIPAHTGAWDESDHSYFCWGPGGRHARHR